jgi:hypothetical protein
MKYGYMNHENRKRDLFVSNVEMRSSSPKISKTDYRETKAQLQIDEIRAKTTPMQLHLTLG